MPSSLDRELMHTFKTSTVFLTLANLRRMETATHREALATGNHATTEDWHILRSSREGLEAFAQRTIRDKNGRGI